MKSINKILLLILVTGLMLVGCKKYFDDVNINPNEPEAVSPAVELTASTALLGWTTGGDIGRYEAILDQQLTGADRQFESFNNYSFVSSDFDQPWVNIYQAMANFDDLNTHALEKGQNAYAGVAKVLLAYSLGVTTDTWGDIPYKEAFKGASGELNPAYDSQESIYNAIQSLLDGAISDFGNSPGAPAPGADDIIYGGDISLWTKLAHALKARYYLHLSNVDAGAKAKALAELPNAFTSSDDDAFVSFGDNAKAANPWNQFYDSRPGYISFIDSKIEDLLVSTSDPRLAEFIDTSADVVGDYYGLQESGIPIMTYAEQKFIEAECQLGTDDDAAATAANDGAIASEVAVTGGNDATWEAANASETAGTITLEKIIVQKYIANFGNTEAYNDWRRTGFPTLASNSSGEIPRRFLYAQTELDRNTKAPHGVSMLDKIWWDQ